MARQLICDICESTYTEQRQNQTQNHRKIELYGKTYMVYVDVTNEDSPDYCHLDVCLNCKKQALEKLLEI